MTVLGQCELWYWHGQQHSRCIRLATVRSEIPARITRQACDECHRRRLKEAPS